ncbi:unnamed protein product [Adineta ricciae]|uniref:Nuclear receptor domain-containing protein n=1 Tax=Adineta ricciae TaxID=249248 RepID=A0A814XNK3_ADIRI|nr:unnamed protein product [Adineta ricciae]CAF1476584.1 unnamed protein product [Adineta ricciae]
MTYKRPFPVQKFPPSETKSNLSQNYICHVCGDKAHVINYGALSCSSCKTFFRRHGFYSQRSLVCHFDGKCSVTTETRKFCTACRFAKCLSIGMNSDFIRKEDLSSKNRQTHLMKYNSMMKKIIPLGHLATLDLLRNDRSSLTPFDWNMLSNVTHAFDKFSPASQTQRFLQRLCTWPQHLSFDISQILILFTQFYTSIESFISSSADFQTLTLPEKHSLYHRNLHGVLNLYATFILSISGMFDTLSNDKILTSVYGYQMHCRLKNLIIKLEADVTIIKLMLLILAFSTNCYMVDDHGDVGRDSLLLGTFRLLGSQNMYIEILWKYMMHRYGYYNASMHLLLIVKTILGLLDLSANIHQTNKFYQDFVEEAAEFANEELTRHENEVVILWGRE